MSEQVLDYTNPIVVRQAGIKALSEALGPVGMAYFFRQFEPGEGNYTEEREELLKDYTMEKVLEELEVMKISRESGLDKRK